MYLWKMKNLLIAVIKYKKNKFFFSLKKSLVFKTNEKLNIIIITIKFCDLSEQDFNN